MDFLGKDTGVGCRFLLQRLFLTQGSSPVSCIIADSLPTEPPGKPVDVNYMLTKSSSPNILLFGGGRGETVELIEVAIRLYK